MVIVQIDYDFKPLRLENLQVSEKARITDRGKEVKLTDLKLLPRDTGFYLFLEMHELGFEVVGIETIRKLEQEGVSDAKQRPAAATELAKFEGTWVLVSSERNGLVTSEEKNPYLLTFTGDKWKVHRGDEVAVEGTVRLVDVAATPRKFDLIKPPRLAPGT